MKKIWGSEKFLKKTDKVWIKEIVAKDRLSVQVHDNKNETWMNLSDETATVFAGLEEGVSLAEAIRCGDWENCLRYIRIEKGVALYIPIGTVHAIASGTLIEVGDPVDRTLRIFDWGRDRELHIAEAIAAVNEDNRPMPFKATEDEKLVVLLEMVDKKHLSTVGLIHHDLPTGETLVTDKAVSSKKRNHGGIDDVGRERLDKTI